MSLLDIYKLVPGWLEAVSALLATPVVVLKLE